MMILVVVFCIAGVGAKRFAYDVVKDPSHKLSFLEVPETQLDGSQPKGDPSELSSTHVPRIKRNRARQRRHAIVLDGSQPEGDPSELSSTHVPRIKRNRARQRRDAIVTGKNISRTIPESFGLEQRLDACFEKSPWKGLEASYDRKELINRLTGRTRALMSDPSLLDQRKQNLCGPTAIVYWLLRINPTLFLKGLESLWCTGKFKTPKYEVNAKHRTLVGRTLEKKFSNHRHIPLADWIWIASLRHTENFWGAASGGVLSQMTVPNDMVKWANQMLGLEGQTVSEVNKHRWLISRVHRQEFFNMTARLGTAQLNVEYDRRRGGVAFLLVVPKTLYDLSRNGIPPLLGGVKVLSDRGVKVLDEYVKNLLRGHSDFVVPGLLGNGTIAEIDKALAKPRACAPLSKHYVVLELVVGDWALVWTWGFYTWFPVKALAAATCHATVLESSAAR